MWKHSGKLDSEPWSGLSKLFQKIQADDADAFCDLRSDSHIAVFSDYSKNSAKDEFSCFSFLIVSRSIESLAEWDNQRRELRRRNNITERQNIRFSSSDNKVFLAIPDFLNIGDLIKGVLVSFVVTTPERYNFENIDQMRDRYNCNGMKLNTLNRMLVISQLLSFLLSGLTTDDQKVMWITDEDDITSNFSYLESLFSFAVKSVMAMCEHSPFLLLDTDSEDNFNDFIARDLVAYADLITGVLMKCLPSALHRAALQGSEPLILDTSHKSKNINKENKNKAILNWAAGKSGNLRKHIVLIDMGKTYGKTYRELLIKSKKIH